VKNDAYQLDGLFRAFDEKKLINTVLSNLSPLWEPDELFSILVVQTFSPKARESQTLLQSIRRDAQARSSLD
jgi:hypothetical protein